MISRTTIKDEVLDILSGRFPDGDVPYGTYTAIANELSTTRHNVSHIALHAGYRIVATPTCKNGHPRAIYRSPALPCRVCHADYLRRYRARKSQAARDQAPSTPLQTTPAPASGSLAATASVATSASHEGN